MKKWKVESREVCRCEEGGLIVAVRETQGCMRKRKCVGERERAFERQQEDTEKEMNRRLGGKKQTSSFLPQNP